jgi:sterol 24-C-methyltransferase
LKPGGVFGFYEWNMTDKWDASNPMHKEVAHGIEVSTLVYCVRVVADPQIGCGIASLRPIAEARQALKNVGFEILVDDDLADRDDPVDWWYPLEGNVWKAQTMWDSKFFLPLSWILAYFSVHRRPNELHW